VPEGLPLAVTIALAYSVKKITVHVFEITVHALEITVAWPDTEPVGWGSGGAGRATLVGCHRIFLAWHGARGTEAACPGFLP
jgi:hypothetical protein